MAKLDKYLCAEAAALSSIYGISRALNGLGCRIVENIKFTRQIFATGALGLIAAMCGACSSAEMWSTHGGHMLVTTADYRTINQTSTGSRSVQGRISPNYITCAEPSPDVAKAVSTALSTSASGGVTLPNGVTADVAAAVSRAHAEALVQLGERLATIQLLRDGLHRACEAYANGAITDTTYAVMLSRFDKTMITMLVSELAAGGFGRSLAMAGAESDGHAETSADLAAKISKSRELEEDLKNAQEAQNAAAQDVAAAKTPDAQKAANDNLDNARKNVQKKDGDFKNALKAAAASAAKVAQINAGSGIKASDNLEVAKTLAEMQRMYIENLNFDAIEVACISALDRDQETASAEVSSRTPFGGYCRTDLLPAIAKLKGELWKAVIQKAEKPNATADNQKEVVRIVEERVKAAGGNQAPATPK